MLLLGPAPRALRGRRDSVVILAVAAFFGSVFGAGYILGWLRGARWLDDPSAHHHEQRRRA